MKPLDGIRVLDLTRLLPGAVCTMMLVDMGAEVIKIEDPKGGDYARWMPPMLGEYGAFFRSSNRGKKSIILDLKAEQGQAILHRLVEATDVLIEGNRPGVMARLNADYDTLREINPRLVYCSLSGWGQTGPYKDVGAHDLNYLSRIGFLGAQETPQALGGQVADVGGSYVGVMGILGALLKRERTGEGDFVDVALSESAMPFSMVAWVESYLTKARYGQGWLNGGMAYYRVYYSQDDQALALGAIEPKFWANFCNAIGKLEWIEGYTEPDNQPALKQKLTELFRSKTADEWETLLAPADCCFTRIVSPDEIGEDPQVKARGMVGVTDEGLPWMRSPIRLMDDEITIEPAPDYGADTKVVLLSAGYSAQEIEQFSRDGVVK